MRSLLPIFAVFIISISCCDDDERPLACGAEDPVDEFTWLRAIVEDLEQSTIKEYFYVVQAEFKGNTVFYVNNCCPFCMTVIIYRDCNGNALELANADVASLKDEKIIWKPDNFACQLM